MSDIFDFNGDYNNPSQNNEHTQSRNEYWAKKNERRAQLNEEFQQDLDRYSVNISQEDYNIIKDAIANAEVPEDEAYRWACAMELNKQYDMPVAYAYQNLEQINAAKWGDRFTFTPKTNFKAIVDSGRLGANTLKMGRLGSKIMKAQMFGKTEYNNYLVGKVESVDDMIAEYAALEQESVGLQDLEDRNLAIEAIKFGAQSAPYTAYVAGVGLLGGLLSGGVGTAAAFAVSMDNAAGLEYMRLRKAGSDVGDAAGFAILSGGLQALVETSLGNVAGALGKKSLGDLASQAVKNKITGNVFKRLAYNGTFKDLALRMGKEWLKENAEEGLEEVVQDLIEKGTDALAAELGGYEIEGLDAKTIARDAWENFRGGVMGSLILGLGPSVIKQKHDIKEFINVRNLAEVTPSLETFNKFTDDSTLWEGMSAEEKKNAQKTTWENAQARVEAAATAEAQKIAEGRDAAEGAEEAPAENEDGTTEANPVARDERGRLYTSDDVSTDDAGNVTGGTFAVGDKTKSENNRYGYIKYSQDAEGNITIQDFKMTNGREGLRAEAFDEFAREHPDVNIEWNPKAGEWEDAKQELIDANPSGKKNGLNYYSTADLDNVAARKQVAEELRKNIHNVKRNADGSYTQTELNNKQIAAGITLIESAARRMNMGLNEYVNKTFGSQIFGSREEFASASLAQGEDVNKKAGGMYQGVAQANWREVGQQIKAVIYAGEHADFSTWAHEMAHVYQNQLDGQLKTDAEAAFNVQGGDWINSTYTFKDGRIMSSAEAFAYGFQDWLENGKAENEQMRNIFQKFAEFIADCYNRLKSHLDFTPEIESVFNRLLDGDDTIMSKALKAAQEQDNEYRASLKRQAEERQAAKEAEKEEAKKQAEAAREEASEGTDFENTQEEQSTEEIESKLDDVTNETEKTDNAIDNALENTNLTDEQKAEISEVLNDASTTVVEKAEAATEAASSVYDDESEIDSYPDLMFQLAGEPSIRRMAESEERERILTELDAAQLLDEKYKSMDANSRAARIRRATGWEKDASGQWKYELDDSVNRIKTEFFKANPGILSGIPYLLNLGDILEADELYKVFPYMKNVRVSFYSDPNAFRAVLTPQGIKVNTRYLQGMNGETGLKGVLAHEIQHIIQAMEFTDSKGLQGADIEQLYNDVMKAMQAAGERKYNYDLTSLQQGLDAYMQDAGEIEARNVARRIMMNADQRRMNTLASTEDVKRGGLLFQEETDAEKKIDEVIQFAKNTDNTLKKENYGKVSKVLSDNAKIHGVDIEGYSHSIDNYFIKHEIKRNKNLTDEDFKKIPDVINNADYIIYGSTVKTTGNNAITYVKNDKDSCIFVEEIRNGKKTLAAQSMSKTSRTFNVQSIMTAPELYAHSDPSTIQIVDVKKEIVNPNLLFQTVYHGSPYNFENFSTENIGTGEGAQAFGWGLYFTNQEGIARFYADKLANEPARISLISKNEYLKSRKKSLRDVENKEKYEARIIKNINHFKKELKQAQKAGDESEIKFYEGLIDDSIKQLDEKERLSYVEAFKKDIANAEKEIKELKASMKNNRNLYTVDIPDEGYLVWDKHVSPENIEGIKAALKDRGIIDFTRIDNLVENQEKWKDNPNATYTFGGNFYKVISDYLGGDKEASLFLKDLGYIGIDYPANSFTGYTSEGERNYVIFDEKNANIKKHLLYQNVYHGSGADFDEFDTENFGLSGEGTMSFGYGTYVTDSEDIARDYANRQGLNFDKVKITDDNRLYYDIAFNISRGFTFEDAKEKLLESTKKSIEQRRNYIERVKASKLSEEDKKFKLDYSEKRLQEDIADLEKIEKLLPSLTVEDVYNKLGIEKRRYLYTVEIPDDGYLDWDKKAGVRNVRKIAKALEEKNKNITYWLPNHIKDLPMEDKLLYTINNQSKTGKGTNEDLYEALSIILGNEKEASKFLHSLGYAGIKYPAGTIHGNGNGAYNYVIFNDDDAKIVDKLLFQTQAELMDEAKTFDSWQEFMNYCQLSDDEQNAFENDEAWYKSFWEQANAITKEQEKKAEAEERRQEAEADTPEMIDRLFISYIKNNPEVVDNFVQQVSDIMEMDLGGDEWAQVDEEGGRERERYAVLQDYISAELRDGNWQTAIAKVQGGHEITDYIRKRLVTEMTDSYKARDFRNLYAAVMKEKRFTVDALDTRAAEIERKLEKYSKRYYDIVSPTEDVTITTPQRRKEIAREMQNRDLAARIKAGSLKVDDEVYNYLKSVEKKEKDLKKQEQQLTDKIQGLYQDVGNTGLQMLINTHEKLMEQKARLNNRNADIQRKVDRGLRMTDRYTRQTQDMTQTYHELERKFSDLKDSMVITDEVQQILDAQEQRREIREEVTRITKERYLADETKKIRVNLVKQLFRKVPLDKVDFKQAQLIIAIQKLTLPNMIGGVNRWIGRNSPFLNAVLSRIVTDSEYKERIVNYLEHVEKQTDTFRDFVESIRNAKSREDFENWGVAEREYAIKYLPKENWVWELKLKEKARDLQESLHLDITQEKVERQVYDADGHPVEDDEGKLVMETAYQFKIGDEALNKLLQETLGEELFSRLMNSPMVEWSTQEMEELVARVNQIRDEGITMRAAKLEARKREAQKFMQRIEQAVKDTGITINPDDTPEEKEKKLEKINKILGKNTNLKGTDASKDNGFIAKLNRILHGYKDANVLRVARILDNQSEGVNTYLLYRKEDDCYNAKMRSIMQRGETVHKVMAANKINEGELAKSIPVEELGTKVTVDELLFFLAADKDFQLDENGKNDNYAATSRNAVCYGNMMSDTASQELKESWAKLDADMKEAIEKDLLTPEQRQLLSDNQLDTRPGTTAYITECNRRWDIVIKAANDFLSTHPEYNALLEAIQADYAEQYERMNEVSISEFNVGVNRVKCYVPLVRQENNGETNENKVMEDLLAINGVGKSGVNKGMTQSRTSISPLHQRPVQAGLFRTWCDSVERTEHFITYAPYVRLLNRVYKGNDAKYLRNTIEGRYGKGMLEYIDAYISEVANPNAQNTRSTGAELLHILRGKTAPAYLGWKASAIIKQGLTSPWPYMQFVNPTEYLAACFKCNNPKMWEAIQEKSVFMKNRRMDPINDLVDEMSKNAKNKVDKFWSNFTKTGMQGLEFIDWACVAPGWYACYTKKYNQLQKASEARYNAKMAELEERNKSGNGEVLNPTQMETIARQEMLEDIEVEAITYADDCTRQCQPSNRLTDLAPMFKDKNEFMRAFLQFQTSLNVIWQNLRYDMPYAVKNKEFTRIAGTVIGYVCAGIFMNSVMEGIDGDDDDDEKQALRNLIYYSTTQFTDAIPIMGSEITNTMDQLITGKRGFYGSGTDMTPSATKLLSVLTTAKKGNWEKAAELTAEGIGLYLGAPVSGTKEINKLLGKPLSEGDVNIKRGITDVYGIAGDILEE